MAAKSMPDIAYLRECFAYDPMTGVLTWKTRPREHFRTYKGWAMWSCRYPGGEAGRRDRKGYVYIKLDHAGWFAHRLIWKLQTGDDIGSMQIDHHNGDKSDNRWTNLRLATHGQNIMNRPKWVGKTLPKGVFKHDSRFRVQCRVRGRIHQLGNFATAEEASAAYLAFTRQHHGEFFFEPQPQEM